jgi:hypothetical protein
MLSRKSGGSSTLARPSGATPKAPANENFVQRWYRVYYADPIMRAKVVSRAQNFGMFLGAGLLIHYYGHVANDVASEMPVDPNQQTQ